MARLEAGDLVEAANDLQGFYAKGDMGTVQTSYVKDDGEKRILVVWSCSGQASSIREDLWESSVKFLRKQRLEVGDLVQALPGKELTLDGTEFYKAGDEATVQSFIDPAGPDEHVQVAWARTGQISTVPTGNWMTCCQLIMKRQEALTKGTLARVHGLQGAKHLNGVLVTCELWDAQKGRWTVRLQTGEEKSLKPENLMSGKGVENLRAEDNCSNQEQLSIGDVVQVLPGNRLLGFYEAGDEGTVQEFNAADDGDDRIHIVWAGSGKSASISKKSCMTAVRLVRKQNLEVGDVIEALPGMELVREDKEYYRGGDRATVIEFRSEPQGELARVLWERTNVVSDLPKAKWMSFVRVVQKGGGIAGGPGSPTRAGGSNGSPGKAGYSSTQVPVAPAAELKVGQRARVHGLQGAAHRNGSIVECRSWDAAKGRWLVHIVTDECLVKPLEMSIKPTNLIAL
jgi:hypothetical protein